jgi:enediyne polyketide synthase
MRPSIVVVGMGCRYPDANDPGELWTNVLTQRRSFRRMPRERLDPADYVSPDRTAPDRTYCAEAAVLEGFEFDRLRFRVVGSTYRAADLAHWLALDVAAQALEDAGFPDGDGLPRETTGVLLGNTLTGEFSRANTLRLRWPYVRRTVEAELMREGWPPDRRRDFLQTLEERYKAPFPPIGEESLAGGLSNTIAGRICNQYDLKGGGYTVDGACSSSLLAIANACSALTAGDLDAALAGGVDLSLDPFEIVGFAKTGALAPGEMRVYDARSAGFWPGEGCGFVVLMRREDAEKQGRRAYAEIRGWGVSSDGSGGITRPEVDGQLLALGRAYRRAGIGPDRVSYFEGHGTGTTIGDATELRVLQRAREQADPEAPAAALGSIKANIGHTKAAAGAAGFLKATLAVHSQIVPPTTGCFDPHPQFADRPGLLEVRRRGETWPREAPLVAAVSSMGFGGINTHLVVEGLAEERRTSLTEEERALLRTPQDAELFLFSAEDPDGLAGRVERVAAYAGRLSRGELADLAATLAGESGDGRFRGAVVARNPTELADRLEALADRIAQRDFDSPDLPSGVSLGEVGTAPRIGFLFPGQGSPAHLGGGLLARRFDAVRALYERSDLPTEGEGVHTSIAQPAIATASVGALRVLESVGVTADVAIGHSLGELTALHWAGAWDEATLIDVAAARGRAMGELGSPTGAMAGIGADRVVVDELRRGLSLTIAGLNSPLQTTVSGEESEIDEIVRRARAKDLPVTKLAVSHAFHSPLVAEAAEVLREYLERVESRPLERTVVSTVTGATLAPSEDLNEILVKQVTSPVRFLDAVVEARGRVDLWIEVGPGRVLGNLAEAIGGPSAISTDAGGESLVGLLSAVAAAWAAGVAVRPEALFSDRRTRPFSLDWSPRFLANPCESAPRSEDALMSEPSPAPDPLAAVSETSAATVAGGAAPPGSPGEAEERTDLPAIEVIRALVGERAELPPSMVEDDHRMLSDLHLNSITVSQMVAEGARRLGSPVPASPTDYANATVAEIASALEARPTFERADARPPSKGAPAGAATWIREFSVAWVDRPRPDPGAHSPREPVPPWKVIAPPGSPWTGKLPEALAAVGAGPGVAVCLPPDPDEESVPLLLRGARETLEAKGEIRFLLVQESEGGAAFARTLHLEAPWVDVTVVRVPYDVPDAPQWTAAEVASGEGFSEVRYDRSGNRQVPVLRPLPPAGDEKRGVGIDETDVLLVSGGGKGIAAECALDLARRTGVRLVLLGRSRPEDDEVLSSNLARMRAEGVTFRYCAADVTDADAVAAACREAEGALGPVTAILHGAGANDPELLTSLDDESFRRTMAPKVTGARNLLSAVDPSRLHTFVAFGSLIARTGMPGEADYAVANEWLSCIARAWRESHAHCRCLVVEWSVWSGVGMGERLGRIDALREQGITPITPDEGMEFLRRLLARDWPAESVVVTGRFGEPPTVAFEESELPFLRFLERARIHYPGIELVADAEVSSRTDPYLEDHVFRGERLFPAVLGLEAMAQAVTALTGAESPPTFEDVEFLRPIVVPEGERVTLRTAAVARESGEIDVVVRTKATSFAADHFRATFRSETFDPESEGEQPFAEAEFDGEGEPIDLDPTRHLYGPVLFHTGRFRCLRGYRSLQATRCLAEIEGKPDGEWFDHYLPPRLVLGDPAGRDAAIHAVQACIPHAVILPVGVDRILFGAGTSPSRTRVRARERSQDGDLLIYDLEILDEANRVRERWEGLRLRAVEGTESEGPFAAPLLGPYFERRLRDLLPGARLSVATGAESVPSDATILRALGRTRTIVRRPDGKPEIVGSKEIEASVSRTRSLTMAVVGPGPLGCDVEAVESRPTSVWRDLLGPRYPLASTVAKDQNEDEATAATRVWTASECLTKAGRPAEAPLSLISRSGDGWVLFASGSLVTATLPVADWSGGRPLMLAVVLDRPKELEP